MHRCVCDVNGISLIREAGCCAGAEGAAGSHRAAAVRALAQHSHPAAAADAAAPAGAAAGPARSLAGHVDSLLSASFASSGLWLGGSELPGAVT